MAVAQKTRKQIEMARPRVSYEKYLALAGEAALVEWVDGEVIKLMPPIALHQSLLLFLAGLLDLFVRSTERGRVFLAPFEMRLERSAREPDILFIAAENLPRLTAKRLDGPADLVVEIVSTDSVQRDRQDKFHEYTAAGVREYWVVDPRPGKQRADFFTLEEGVYRLFATEDDEKVASFVVEGFWLRPAWLWQAETLHPLEAFYEIAGLSSEALAELREKLEA